MRPTLPHRDHGSKHAWKDLSLSLNFHPRFDNVSDAGNPNLCARSHHLQRCILYMPIFEDKAFEFSRIDLQGLGAITKLASQGNLSYRKLRHLKPHSTSPNRRRYCESKILGFGHYSRQGAKTLSSEKENNDPQTTSLLIIQ